jgi:hypothetical protein
MRNLIAILILMSCAGCVSLTLTLDKDGISLGAGVDSEAIGESIDGWIDGG